jgi:hypothetical protein
MAYTVPAATASPALGNVKVLAAVSIAAPATPDLSTELDAVTTVDLSCALLSDGFKPNADQSKTTKRRRLCAKSDSEILGPTTYKFDKLMYSTGDPQSPDASTVALMVEGARVYLVERLGLDADAALAVAQKVRTHYVELGAPVRVYDANADNGEFYIEQELVYVGGTGPVDGAIVA